MKTFFWASVTAVLLTACAETLPEWSQSAIADKVITEVDIQTSAMPEASEANDAGPGDNNTAGTPSSSSPPSSADTQDLSPSPASGSPHCVPNIPMGNALLSAKWARRHGTPLEVELVTVRLSDPDRKAKLAQWLLKLEEYKRMLRTGWGNMELHVMLCDDKNQDGRCSAGEAQKILVRVHAPVLVHGRCSHSQDDEGNDEENVDFDRTILGASQCVSQELRINLSPQRKSERQCSLRIHGVMPVLLRF